MKQNSPAVGAPLDASVRPRAWAWKDEPSGIEVYSGWDEPRPTNGSEPLYDQAAIDALLAAERFGWEQLVRGALEVMENHRSEHAQSRIGGVVSALRKRLGEAVA